jgi:hypothetical protein
MKYPSIARAALTCLLILPSLSQATAPLTKSPWSPYGKNLPLKESDFEDAVSYT